MRAGEPSTTSPDPADCGGRVVGGALPPAESAGRRRAVRLLGLLALGASFAYLAWRAGFTLGNDLWISVPVWVVELYSVAGLAMFTFSLWDLDAAPPPTLEEAEDRRVAVLIPTYNEPREVLLPTVAAAVALSPAHETWVLDDGNRPWVEALAASLGARYLARAERLHAKAGNINNALDVVDAEFVAVLDADHVALPGLLTHTLGYFSDPQLALVQTPQEFYNLDSFEHGKNRSWFWRESRPERFNEQRLFYRAIQPGKNRWNAAFWCGTNAVVRVTALRSVGGVACETLTEDMHTTIRMHRRGWHTLYHNEVLARGLAARTAAEYQAQRVRWGTGAMQVIRLEHPMTRPGLSIRQRLAYLATLSGWFDAWRDLAYVLLPLVVLFTGANPIQAPVAIFAAAFGATFLLQRVALTTLARGYAPQGMATLFEFIRMESGIRACSSLFTRRSRPFTVTSKAGASSRRRVPTPRLLRVLLFLTGAAAIWFACTLAGLTPVSYPVRWTVYAAAVWGAVNAVLLAAAVWRIRSDRFATERRAGVRMAMGGAVTLDGEPGMLVDLSMGGALVRCGPMVQAADVRHELRIRYDSEEVELIVETRGQQRIDGGSALLMLRFVEGQDLALANVGSLLFGAARHPAALRSAPALMSGTGGSAA